MPNAIAAARGLAARERGRVRQLRTFPIERVELRNRVLRPLRRRQFAHFGAGSFVDRPAWLYGTEHIHVGDGVRILEGAWLAVELEARGGTGPVLSIGDRVSIRTGVTISAAISVTVEADVGIGGYVTIIDSRHTWGESPNVMLGPLERAPVRIGEGTWLADRVTVSAGTDIGRRCAIGSNAVVSGRIPDFSVVVGNPGRIVGTTRP